MLQQIEDFVIFVGWAFHNITLLVKQFFLPVRYVFAFLQTAIHSAFGTPIEPESLWGFDTGTLGVIHSFPYFDTLVAGIFIGLGIIFLVATLKMFHRV